MSILSIFHRSSVPAAGISGQAAQSADGRPAPSAPSDTQRSNASAAPVEKKVVGTYYPVTIRKADIVMVHAPEVGGAVYETPVTVTETSKYGIPTRLTFEKHADTRTPARLGLIGLAAGAIAAVATGGLGLLAVGSVFFAVSYIKSYSDTRDHAPEAVASKMSFWNPLSWMRSPKAEA